MIEKESLKEFGELIFSITNSKARTAELVDWASMHEKRISKMTEFLNNNIKASYSEMQYQMSLIVAEESS